MIDPNRNDHEDKNWELDAVLDSLLHSYSKAEPRPGFETRLRAVVGEQATRVRRPRWLMLAASAAALAAFAWMMIATPHKTKTSVAGPEVAHDSSSAATNPDSKIVIQLTAPSKARRSPERSANMRSDKANRIVLQMAAATQGSGSVIFEQEKLYLSPEKPLETAAAAAPEEETQASTAPAVSIKSIGVASIESNAPIEIKDLALPKSSNEKGSL
jgi:hypothetical protein